VICVKNLASPWTCYSNSGRAYYEHDDEDIELTLEEPMQGVKEAIEEDGEDFDEYYAPLLRRKKMIEAGEINLTSPWTRITSGGRAIYERGDDDDPSNSVERTLQEPEVGVQDEVETDDEDFEKFYTQLLMKHMTGMSTSDVCRRFLQPAGVPAGWTMTMEHPDGSVHEHVSSGVFSGGKYYKQCCYTPADETLLPLMYKQGQQTADLLPHEKDAH